MPRELLSNSSASSSDLKEMPSLSDKVLGGVSVSDDSDDVYAHPSKELNDSIITKTPEPRMHSTMRKSSTGTLLATRPLSDQSSDGSGDDLHAQKTAAPDDHQEEYVEGEQQPETDHSAHSETPEVRRLDCNMQPFQIDQQSPARDGDDESAVSDASTVRSHTASFSERRRLALSDRRRRRIARMRLNLPYDTPQKMKADYDKLVRIAGWEFDDDAEISEDDSNWKWACEQMDASAARHRERMHALAQQRNH